jgi:hypothetical protein
VVHVDFCSEVTFISRIPSEIFDRIFDFRSDNPPDNPQYLGKSLIDMKRMLKLRLVCKEYDNRITNLINNCTPYLEKFCDFIGNKKRTHILQEEVSFLNKFPNLRTRLNLQISEIYLYLFYQDFSFCSNSKDYAILYEKQKAIVLESLRKFDKAAPKSTFRCDYIIKYGWSNHGWCTIKTGRECCFSFIGFLFFDLGFFPPPEFWNEPYNQDTINPVTVLISLSFNPFFQKALEIFIRKIPDSLKNEIIQPVIQKKPDYYYDSAYLEHFETYTKPRLQKRLENDYDLPKPTNRLKMVFLLLKGVLLKAYHFCIFCNDFFIRIFSLIMHIFKKS